jgi:hypothetical protein
MRAAHVKQGLQAILQAMKTDLQSLGQSLLGVAALRLLLAIAWHLSETTLKEHTVKHTLNRNQLSVSPKLSDLLRSGKSNQHSPVGSPPTTPETSTAQWHHPPAVPVQKQLKGTLWATYLNLLSIGLRLLDSA